MQMEKSGIKEFLKHQKGDKMKMKRARILFGMIVLAVSLSFMTSSCMVVDEFEVLRGLIDGVIENLTPTINVTDVKMIIDNPAEAANYNIVSVRSADDYAIGHVPGAINIPWKTIADDASLAQLNADNQIAYCYTGHTGQVADTILAVLGYDTRNMKFGMMGWTDDPDVLATTPFDCEPPNYDTETTVNDLPADNDLPILSTGEIDPTAIAKAQAQAYLGSGLAPTISVTDVKMIVDDPSQADDYIIVSVRAADAYAIGHVPGAINIPWKTIAEVDNLKKLDPEKTIITYCYTGHTGQVACTLLNLLGYEAKNMKFGMMGWTDDPDVLATTPFDCEPPNYDTEAGG
jgi:rhodanese-related sulfurtransferase